MYVRVEMCMGIKLIIIKVSGKIEGATSETTAHSISIMIKIVLKIKIYHKR